MAKAQHELYCNYPIVGTNIDPFRTKRGEIKEEGNFTDADERLARLEKVFEDFKT